MKADASTAQLTPTESIRTSYALKRQIPLWSLVGIIFFSVSGGAYGLEELVASSGPGLVAVILFTMSTQFVDFGGTEAVALFLGTLAVTVVGYFPARAYRRRKMASFVASDDELRMPGRERGE